MSSQTIESIEGSFPLHVDYGGAQRPSCLRMFFSLVPVVYVWSLPHLGDVYIKEGVTFANRCTGFPLCTDTLIGVSVASLIETPQATGAFASAFFFPMLYLWLPGCVVEGDRWAHTTLLTFQLCFGMTLIWCPILGKLDLRELPQQLFRLAAIAHYGVMLRHCHRERRKTCKFLVIGIVFAEMADILLLSALMLSRSQFSQLPAIPRITYWAPWTYYIFESVGLGAIALFPLFWHRSEALATRSMMPPRDATLAPIGTSFFSLGNSSSALKRYGTVLSIIYIWLLPLLASFNIFVHRCRKFPLCTVAEGDEHALGESVSDMICTPEATGAFACAMFWPAMHFWMPGAQVPDSVLAYVLLVVFQVSFGCFLSCPVIYVPKLHFLVVALFCVACVAHLTFTLWHCWKARLIRCVVCLTVAVLMLATLVFINFLGSVDLDFFRRGPLHSWCFYFCEAVGLSAIAGFPLLWRRSEELPLRRLISPSFATLALRSRTGELRETIGSTVRERFFRFWPGRQPIDMSS